MIAVTRRWAVGSDESVKTIRAKTGTSIVLFAYLLGLSLPVFIFFARAGHTDALDDKRVFALFMVALGVTFIGGPFWYVFKVFTESLVQEYVTRHKPRSTRHSIIQSICALLFIAGAWWLVFGMPLLVY